MPRHRALRLASAAALSAITYGGPASADPHGAAVQVAYVRIYSQGNSSADVAMIAMTSSTVCSTTNFSITLGNAAAQGILSAALTAVSTGKYVEVEVANATGCTVENNFGPALQSLTLLNSASNTW